MIVSFRFYMMDCVDFVLNCYTHITSHVTQVFASCTHYTSYSLLNIVHVIVCVFRSDQPILKLLWVLFVQNIFCVWAFKGRMVENLNFGITGFKTCVLEKIFISYSCIFILLYSMLWGVFSKIRLFFLKRCFSRFSIDPICFSINRNFFLNFLWASVCFDQSKLIFDQSKIVNELF